MEINFKNKVILITGGLGNLGKRIVKGFCEADAKKIILLDKNDFSESDKDFFSSNISHIDFINIDLEEFKKYSSKVIDKVNEYEGVDILINNAAFVGTSNLDGWNVNYENQTLETWNRAMNLNVAIANELIKALIPLFRSTDSIASILNIASIYGSVPPRWDLYEGLNINNPAAYGASKSALINLTKYLATYLGPKGIRVNSLSPGGIFLDQDAEFVKRYSSHVPLNRMADFDEVAKIAILLSHNDFSYLNGQNIIFDGGFSL